MLNNNITISENNISINKGEKISNILNKYIKKESKFEIFIIQIYYLASNKFLNKFIHFGDFAIEKDITPIDLLNTITKPSNIINKITIVEGWSKKELDYELSKYFKNIDSISYDDIIADTYFFDKNLGFSSFHQNLLKTKKDYLKKFENNQVFKIYSSNEIMILGSLLEKEGLDREDKLNIYSVISNRLKKNMKLQIDATVLFAITNGEYNLNRDLLYKDLKFADPFNTYIFYGLPPEPISYVGKKTLDIIFENHESDFLFYFFNNSLKRHIFSKTYEEHKNKLNEYRKQK